MLQVCAIAGHSADRVLADDAPPPVRTDSAYALTTDDIMVFARQNVKTMRRTMAKLDRAFVRLGVEKHPGKDVRAASSATCIGIDVCQGRFLAPSATSLVKLFCAVLYMWQCGAFLQTTPHQLAALLGVMQWHCQLNRPSFSVFHCVYEFTKSLPGNVAKPIPKRVFEEIALFIFLVPCLEADLARPWLGDVLASDASSAYGFGLCGFSCHPRFARSVGQLAARPGAFAQLDPDCGEDVVLPKAGVPHRLGLRMSRFRTILSVRKQHQVHSGALEASAVTLILRWLLRSPGKHGKRVAALVDAQAVIGALAKGRSSAPTLRR